MLHMNLSERATHEILHLLERLSKEGEEVELLDDKIYHYERVMIAKALKEVDNGEVYSSEEVMQYIEKSS